jgi:hypothetical protein
VGGVDVGGVDVGGVEPGCDEPPHAVIAAKAAAIQQSLPARVIAAGCRVTSVESIRFTLLTCAGTTD